MKNIVSSVDGNILTLKIDLSQRHGLSSTGKSITIASSEGFEKVGDQGISFSLNVNQSKRYADKVQQAPAPADDDGIETITV